MIVENVIVTTINEAEYTIEHCDAGRPDEHFEVRVTRKDEVATERWSGMVVVGLRFPILQEAIRVYTALTTVALLDQTVTHEVAALARVTEEVS